MDYELKGGEAHKTYKFADAARSVAPLLADEKANIAIALVCVVITSTANLLSPAVIARVVDTAIPHHDYGLLLRYGAVLIGVYLVGLTTAYFQTLRMGGVGRRVLFKLRNRLFLKFSNLPIAFFAQ
ncbi:MAG: multidrug transporter, partial [Caulobacteraceae bacterium]|nr:multidrug transporter [Caulobacteraceae bacterium]